jgi:endonuclease V-like protein UPF0215 family
MGSHGILLKLTLCGRRGKHYHRGVALSHVVGVDDAPFSRTHRGDVRVVATVFASRRLDGVLVGRVRRDGANAARALAELVGGSRFAAHLQVVMLQGIALAGFNVVDLDELHARLGLPLLVVARRRPNLDAIRAALLSRVPGGRRKWALIERAGPMEPLSGLWVQRVGLARDQAAWLLARTIVHGKLPEPLRAAHLIAGALETGQSRGRP